MKKEFYKIFIFHYKNKLTQYFGNVTGGYR